MDAMSVLAGWLGDEVMRYLYLVSLHASPQALIVAFFVAGTTTAIAGLVGRMQRRWSARQRVVAAGA